MGGLIPSDDPTTITLIERNMQLTDSLLRFLYAENLHQASNGVVDSETCKRIVLSENAQDVINKGTSYKMFS
jgi:hypothetical protein